MIKQILIAIDQLGNALAGGYADQTISGRVGYRSFNGGHTWRWRIVESVIDWAFYPIDGEGHCRQSIEADRKVSEHTTAGFVAVSVLAISFAVPIGIAIRCYLAWCDIIKR